MFHSWRAVRRAPLPHCILPSTHTSRILEITSPVHTRGKNLNLLPRYRHVGKQLPQFTEWSQYTHWSQFIHWSQYIFIGNVGNHFLSAYTLYVGNEALPLYTHVRPNSLSKYTYVHFRNCFLNLRCMCTGEVIFDISDVCSLGN